MSMFTTLLIVGARAAGQATQGSSSQGAAGLGVTFRAFEVAHNRLVFTMTRYETIYTPQMS
jgi:hypothetical protein